MAERTENHGGPRWGRLFEIAAAQEGHFTTSQAAEAGYSPQLLSKYLDNGRIVRVRRSVYRLVHFPPGRHESLVVIWLWSGQLGVFSHETALALHNLSSEPRGKVHLTVPSSWKSRRVLIPGGVVLHFSDLVKDDVVRIGAISATSPMRTISDCSSVGVSPRRIRLAIEKGIQSGVFTSSQVETAVDS